MDEEKITNPELEDIEEENLEKSLRPQTLKRIYRTKQSKREYGYLYKISSKKEMNH